MKRKRRWAISIALVVAVLVAAGCGSKTGIDECGLRLDDERRRDLQPALLDARRDRHVERLAAQGRLADPPERRRAWPRSTPVRASRSSRTASSTSRAGNDDVFAVSVDSGKILWQYKANLDQKISTVCCGWLNRGVALGDGRVYLGQLDGKVRALDQKTGSRRVDAPARPVAEGPDDHRRAALPRREDLHRRRRRRLRHARLPRGDGRVERRQRLALLHDPGAGRARAARRGPEGDGVPAGRRLGLVDARVRQGSEPALHHDGQRRQRLVRRRPPGRQPLRRVDRRDRPRHRAS